jgi:aspartate dehydrogenase
MLFRYIALGFPYYRCSAWCGKFIPMSSKQAIHVGIAGLGTIGKVVARYLRDNDDGFALSAVSSGNVTKAEKALKEMGLDAPVVQSENLAGLCDVIVDCAPTAAFAGIANSTLGHGKTLVTVSGAALLENPDLEELARTNGGRIILATGALLGLDAVRAAALGTIHSVTMVTRKPPKSLAKAEYVVREGIDLASLTEPLKIFEGTAREGAAAFPANVNVAAALGLAGVGPDQTQLEIWADPALERNTHRIVVDADSARLELGIENVPTRENPGTGRITALSVIAALRGLNSPLQIGS